MRDIIRCNFFKVHKIVRKHHTCNAS